jgi:hypothetical protein
VRRFLLLIPVLVLATALVLSFQSVAASRRPLLEPRHTVGNLTTKATPDVVKAGGTVQLSLTVVGPAEYQPCVPVHFWVEDASGHRAWTEVQFWMCPMTKGPGLIAAGQSTTFSFGWPTRSLAPGVYTVHGWFGGGPATASGNIPTVTVEIQR